MEIERLRKTQESIRIIRRNKDCPAKYQADCNKVIDYIQLLIIDARKQIPHCKECGAKV